MKAKIIIYIMAIYVLLFSTVKCFSNDKRALDILMEFYEKGPTKEETLYEQVSKIWAKFSHEEYFNWDNIDYQCHMIEITIDIEEKYYKFEFNPLQIRSFQAQKFLIEELCRRNKYDEAINCCYKIVTGTILKEQGQQDNPVAHYFAKKAVEVFKEYISKNAKSKTFRTDILFDTLAYACYNSADEDVWFLLSILGQKVGDTNYSSILDSLAIIYWQLRKELSNKQLRYIVNILEKVDKERYYHPDWIVLVSKNKRYAIKLFKKKNFVLENESLRDIQNDIEKSLRRDFFELSED